MDILTYSSELVDVMRRYDFLCHFSIGVDLSLKPPCIGCVLRSLGIQVSFRVADAASPMLFRRGGRPSGVPPFWTCPGPLLTNMSDDVPDPYPPSPPFWNFLDCSILRHEHGALSLIFLEA